MDIGSSNAFAGCRNTSLACPLTLTQSVHSRLKARPLMPSPMVEPVRSRHTMVLINVDSTQLAQACLRQLNHRQLCSRHNLRGAEIVVGMGTVFQPPRRNSSANSPEKPNLSETTNFPALDHFFAQLLTRRRSMHGCIGGRGYSGCQQGKEAR